MGLFSQKEVPRIESLVVNATSETLTREDWSRIIAVCDEISTKSGETAPHALQTLRHRLSLPNGNVQMYGLTLLNAIAQNCGPTAQREIASSATANVLQKLGTSPATHRTVLMRLLDVTKSIAETFAYDPTLAQISMVYDRVHRMHPDLTSGLDHVNQTVNQTERAEPEQLSAYSEPTQNLEDLDLKRAIELSIQESKVPTPAAEIAQQAEHAPPSAKSYVRGLYDFNATEDGELSFKHGDVIEVTDRVYKEWWKGWLNGHEGIFPVNYVEAYTPTDRESPQTYADPLAVSDSPVLSNPAVIDEKYLFDQVPAVEKLLTILASAAQDGNGSSVISNPDVQQLYHQISSMRPRLVQIIDEYALKKDELVKMNQMLLTARRTYENLVSQAASTHHRRVSSNVPPTNSPHPDSIPYTHTPSAYTSASTPLQPQYTHPATGALSPQYTASHLPSPQPTPSAYAPSPAPYAPAPYSYPAPSAHATPPAKLPYPDDKQLGNSKNVAPGAPLPY